MKNFLLKLETDSMMDERLMDEGSDEAFVEMLKPLLGSLEDLEKKESEVVSRFVVEHAMLQAEVNEIEGMLQNKTETYIIREILDNSLGESKEKLNVLKKELASKQRAVLQLHRQLDDIPLPAELLHYELCFSQLYTSIQRKLRQTRKYYDTFNALLEIKEMMLKETSLMNSISSQFQVAISNPVGRTKLVDSMEGILNGIQQKLDKQQLVLEPEQKTCKALKEKHRKALSDQRQCYSLLKAFQDECARNERLRETQSSKNRST